MEDDGRRLSSAQRKLNKISFREVLEHLPSQAVYKRQQKFQKRAPVYIRSQETFYWKFTVKFLVQNIESHEFVQILECHIFHSIFELIIYSATHMQKKKNLEILVIFVLRLPEQGQIDRIFLSNIVQMQSGKLSGGKSYLYLPWIFCSYLCTGLLL